MFLPTTPYECKQLGWDCLDVILVTGDAYIDSPFMGIAVIGNILVNAGFKVGVIPQPGLQSGEDIQRLGEPRLFWGVSGGSIDSMVANYTASGKKRKKDDYTPGGINNRRPDRAVIVYTNLIKQYFKSTCPVVLGGVEASLRRIAHYDAWSNRVRRSILFDAKADFLIYGMGEKAVVELTRALKAGENVKDIKGLCYISPEKKEGYLELPSFQDAARDKQSFITMFDRFYTNNDPITATGVYQKQDTRYLIQNPPQPLVSRNELDLIHGLDYERDLHPYHKHQGPVTALYTIRFSILTHRGCYGECSFCAIAVHQGRTVQWRSEDSILKEVRQMAVHPDFKGNILDVGGPTANMYGFECKKKYTTGSCPDKRCLYPDVCPSLKVTHEKYIRVLQKVRQVPGIKNVFIASGLRHDLVLGDKKHGRLFLTQVVNHHVSGHLKLAPEHSESKVLNLMGKPGMASLTAFKNIFFKLTAAAGKKQFLTYYLIAAHPGCDMNDMRKLKAFAIRELKTIPKQVQIFTPTPSTYATLMYYTEMDPFTGNPLFVEKNIKKKNAQKQCITGKIPKR